MCDELGNEKYMQEYVEEAGSTSLCKASDGAGCGDNTDIADRIIARAEPDGADIAVAVAPAQ